MPWRDDVSVVFTLALVSSFSSAIAAESPIRAVGLLSNAAIEFFPRAASLSLEANLRPAGASLSFGLPEGDASSRSHLDYGLFSEELLAFFTKEVLSDARDEYRYSLIPGPLGRNGVDAPSDFDAHCRIAVEQIGRTITRLFARSDRDQDGGSDYFPSIVGAATAYFIARDAVGGNRRNSDEGESFSLEPKVGSRRIGLRFAIRW